MLRFENLAVAAAMLVFALPAAAVVPVAGHVSSGKLSGGGAVTVGAALEDNWLLNVAAVPWNSGVKARFPIGPWLVDNSVSHWMTPTSHVAANFDPVVAGFGTQPLNVDLSALRPGAASIPGHFAADNQASAITLNGIPLNRADFAASSGLVGEQRQSHTALRSEAGAGNPAGARMEFQTIAVAPAVVSDVDGWAMFVAGFGRANAAAHRRFAPRLEDMGYIRC